MTEQKQAESNARGSEARLRALIEHGRDVILLLDRDGKITYVSPSAGRIRGFQPEEMVGLERSALLHPDDRDDVARQVASVMQRPRASINARYRARHKDGSWRWLDSTTTNLLDEPAVGALVVNSRDVTEEVEAQQLLEQRVVERTREIERRREVAEGLRDLLAAVNSHRTLDEVLEYVVGQAVHLLGSDAGAIYLPDDAHGEATLTIHASRGLTAEYIASSKIHAGRPVTGLAFSANRAVVTADILAMIPAEREPIAQPELADHGTHLQVLRVPAHLDPTGTERVRGIAARFRAILAVPLATKADTYGALALYFREPRHHTDDDVGLAMAFAAQAALAIENAHLHAQAARRLEELEALYRADGEIHRSLRLDEVLRALVDVAADVLKADKSSITVWDEAHQRLVPGATRGFSPESVAAMVYAPGEGVTGRVAATRQPIAINDTHADPHVARHITNSEGIRSLLHVPIMLGADVFGVFGVAYTVPRRLGDAEQQLLLALAQRAALAIQNARLYEQAQHAATLEERQRLARELHDAVTQTLFSTALIAEALPALWDLDQAEARQALDQLRRLTRGALAEMRTLLVELRPGALLEMPLYDLLRQLAEATAGRSRVSVTASTQGEPCTLPADVQVALYRMAQEALSNVVKHAQARNATVDLRYLPDGGLTLCIDDDGHGFDAGSIPAGHLGVSIMRERATSVGASLDVDSRPGHGTHVSIGWTPG